MRSREATYEDSSNYQTRPEIWSGMSKAAKKKEKQEWASEKPKLDNARKLRGFYFIDPEDGVYKEPVKKREKNESSSKGSHAL